jgi:hypothetical protein
MSILVASKDAAGCNSSQKSMAFSIMLFALLSDPARRYCEFNMHQWTRIGEKKVQH